MTNKHTAKRPLFAAILSLVLCLAMFAGTTFAWFTDSITNTKNKIVAGNLDIELKYYDTEKKDWFAVGSDTQIIPNTLWEPGHTEVIYLEISNPGTLALKYQLGVNVFSEVTSINVNNKLLKLSNFIYFDALESETFAEYDNRDDARKAAVDAQLISAGYSNKSELAGAVEGAAMDKEYVALVIYMPESVGNDANYKTGEAIPSIDLGITLMATQTDAVGGVDAEKDSFGSDYDKTADVNAIYTVPGDYDIDETIVLIDQDPNGATDVITASGAGVVVNVLDGYYDVGSKDCAIWAKDGAVVNIYGGTFICDGFEDCDSANHQDMIYAGQGGTINIYGGTFISRSNAWLLNEKDRLGTITVYGGSFYNWDPANNISEGANTSFLASGLATTDYIEGTDTIYEIIDSEMEVVTIESFEEFKQFDVAVDNNGEYKGVKVANNTKVYAKLLTDIDLSTYTAFTGIGNGNGNGFDGVFNGYGHTIKNWTVATNWNYYMALFRTTANIDVKNLTVENFNLGVNTTKGTNYGVLIGAVGGTDVLVENVTIRNCVINVQRTGGAIVGGISNGKLTIKNCTVENVALNNAGYDVSSNRVVGSLLGNGWSHHDGAEDGVYTSNNTITNVTWVAGGVLQPTVPEYTYNK